MTDRLAETRTTPRTLAGTTILQIVPALREEPSARTALSVAGALHQAGARALIAAAPGPLLEELTSSGGEWVPFACQAANPLTASRNVHAIESLIASESVDLIHAHCPSGATAAGKATARTAVRLVTTLPDVPPASSRELSRVVSLARGDRIIAPSAYAATPVLEHYGIPRDQITIIPRCIDTMRFDSRTVQPERVEALRRSWRIAPGDRVVLAPGRLAPWNGQVLLPDVARALVDLGHRSMVFAIVGENRSHRSYTQSVLARAQAQGVEGLFRVTGHYPDIPAALALADVVAIPAIDPPVLGRIAAQAQAMGRLVVTSDVGVLPEQVVVPPYLPEAVRTGWVAAANDADDFARALALSLSLDRTAYHAMSSRARQFAEYMFSPESVAAATQAVYTSLLARDL